MYKDTEKNLHDVSLADFFNKTSHTHTQRINKLNFKDTILKSRS